MTLKEKAKQKLEHLLENYLQLKRANRLNIYNKEMTIKDFLLPLFRALGWNTENSSEVTAEEKVSKRRIDFGFRLNGIPQFFLGAKAITKDLENQEFIQQAINYAWLKGCTWAVLSNFQTVKIYNAEWKTENPFQNHLKTISSHEFINRFEELWLLSKESFEQKLLDREALKWGRKTKKVSVNKQLLLDFTKFRELLSKSITKLNTAKNLTEQELDESVQRILDRLVFIRNCEDRELEPKILISKLREYLDNSKNHFIKTLREIFLYFDEHYNSEIFKKHLCDTLDIEDEILKQVIDGLYFTKDNTTVYDFSIIEADVLGNIYEQYLSHILKKRKKSASLKQSHAHRKEQGVYYTPTYIVDYIVQNTLGEILRSKKSTKRSPLSLRVLDPACGSAFFLIKAFDVLNEYYEKHDKDYKQREFDFQTELSYTSKVKILQNHIYGVDIDKQAVEIARLNLLLKIAEKGKRLPLLGENIKCGNSLIDDKSIDQEGAFEWKDEFKEIMQAGGFDVIIGNPPWVSIKGRHKSINLSKTMLQYFFEKYECDTYRPNFFEMFIRRALGLLKEGGYFSFVVPDRLCANEQFSKLRKYILENFTLERLWFKTPFENVISDNVIFVIKKEKPSLSHKVKIAEYPSLEYQNISQSFYLSLSNFTWIFIREDIFKLFQKIQNNPKTFELGKKFQTKVGFIAKPNSITKIQKSKTQIQILKGENIQKYTTTGNYFFEFQKENLAGGTQDVQKLSKKHKVLLRKTGINLIATFDDSGIYTEQSLYFIYSEDRKNVSELKVLTALLNSKLLNCYYKNFAITNRDSTPQLKKSSLDKFPIILPSKVNFIIQLIEKIIKLNKQLFTLGDKITDKRNQLEKEIQKTEEEINEFVYEIYGLSEKEKEMIESFLLEEKTYSESTPIEHN